MKSIFNFRPLFIIFLGFIVGATYYISIANICNKYWLGLFIVITTLLILMIVYVILGLLNKKSKIMSYMYETYIVWLVMFISIIIFGTIFSTAVAIKNNKLVDIDGNVSYTGVITQVQIYDTYVNVELRDVNYNDIKLNSNLDVTIYTKGSNLEYKVGNKLSATGIIDKISVDSYNVYNYSAIYKTTVNDYNVNITMGKPNIFESIKEKTRVLLNNNMSKENAGIGMAMLYGEKESLGDNITNVFSISGISHILAVSGLHIGVLVGLLLFILKISNANKPTTFAVMGGILLFYMTLCGFSSSVVRASIMAIIMLGAKLYGHRYDNLSSMSLAGIIITLFNPFALFSVGFQLSFACVFAIITLMPTINRFFEYIHFKNKFSSAFAISMSTSVALIPFCAHYFGRISLLTVFTNIVIIPIFSITYIILFVVVVIGLLLKFVGVALVVPNLAIHFIKIIANFVANIPYSYVLVFDVSIITFILVFVMQFILEFMICSRVSKLIVLGVLLLCTTISVIFDFMPREYDDKAIIYFNQYYGNMSIVLHENNEVSLIGYSDKDMGRLKDTLVEYRIKNINNVVLYNTNINIEEFDKFVLDYKVSKIYIPQNEIIDDINIKTIKSNEFYINKIRFEFVSNKGVAIDSDNGYRIIGNEFTHSDLVYLSNKYYDDIYSISISKVDIDYSSTIDFVEMILQKSGEYDANIVLNNQKIWYSNI